MAEGAHQLAAAEGVGEVVLAGFLVVEEDQAAAVLQRMQGALVQARGLLQAVAVAFQQVHQARARQAAQLFLVAELDRQHGAGVRFGRGRRRFAVAVLDGIAAGRHGSRRLGQFAFGEDVFVEDLVLFVDRRQRRHRRGFRGGRLGAGLDGRGGRCGGGRRRRLFRHQARLQLARQVADLVLQGGARGGIVRIAQPYPQLQQRRGNLPAEA
ncbi:hypothetical protein D3C76_828740 [compost metagenome]